MIQPSRRQLAEIALDMLDKVSSKKLSRSLAAYLMTNKRTAELGSLLRDIQLLQVERGQVEIEAISVSPLNISTKAEIKKLLSNLYPKSAKLTIRERHDPKVIGGVRLEAPNVQLDASVRSRLYRLKQIANKA